MGIEYCTLSNTMRGVVPLRRMTIELCKCLELLGVNITNICKIKVHKDNQEYLKLAQLEPGKMTPRFKTYGVTYYWFRYQLKPNNIIIKCIKPLC